jgi:hypothetical protein
MTVCYDCGWELGEDDWYRVIREEAHTITWADGRSDPFSIDLPISVWVCSDEVGCKRRANARRKEEEDGGEEART